MGAGMGGGGMGGGVNGGARGGMGGGARGEAGTEPDLMSLLRGGGGGANAAGRAAAAQAVAAGASTAATSGAPAATGSRSAEGKPAAPTAAGQSTDDLMQMLLEARKKQNAQAYGGRAGTAAPVGVGAAMPSGGQPSKQPSGQPRGVSGTPQQPMQPKQPAQPAAQPTAQGAPATTAAASAEASASLGKSRMHASRRMQVPGAGGMRRMGEAAPASDAADGATKLPTQGGAAARGKAQPTDATPGFGSDATRGSGYQQVAVGAAGSQGQSAMPMQGEALVDTGLDDMD